MSPVNGQAHGSGTSDRAGQEETGAAARLFWRTVEEREGRADDSPAYPPAVDDAPSELTRRDFVKLMAASAALAATACGLPDQRILPYVHAGDGAAPPGVPRHYATAMLRDGFAVGLLVESRDGRPTKVEGNPDHPASLGATGPHEQASILELYDPGRARTLTRRGERSSVAALMRELAGVRAPGAGLRFLLEPTSSPMVGALVTRLRSAYPEARFTFWSPLAVGGAAELARARYGSARAVVPQYDLTVAARILSLDADFLGSTPFGLRYSRQWADRRMGAVPDSTTERGGGGGGAIRVPAGGGGLAADASGPDPRAMSRLYAVESTLSVTGAAADHRLAVRPEQVGAVLAAIGAQLAARPDAGALLPARTRAALAPHSASPYVAWAGTVAADLAEHPGAGAIVVGERQPAAVHALAYTLNQALGNVGRTTWFTASPLVDAPGATQSLEALVAEMLGGRVDTLFILGGNPVYSAPVDLAFEGALRRVPRSVYHGLHRNETARVATWFVPAAHFLESWSDGRAYDGTASLVQPLIAPLWGGWTEAQLLAALPGVAPANAPAGAAPGTASAATVQAAIPDPHALLRQVWRGTLADDAAWEEALQRGVIDGSAFPREVIDLAAPWEGPFPEATTAPGLSIEFRPDPSMHDGRFANNAWLQELPDPITKLTWGNAALVSPPTAARLGVSTGDVLRLELRGRSVEAPAFVLPGQADETLTLPLGYGHAAGEGIGRGVGYDANALRTAAAPFADTGAVARSAGRHETLATTQTHWSMQGRPILLAATAAEYAADPHFAREQQGPTPSLYDAYRYTGGNQWAMVVDTSICTGCSACVVACQAENNIPIVGKQGVLQGREMHWLRIDRYFTGSAAEPRLAMQPMLCQHCEHAPCEYVCPVEATVHSPEGLNEMVYNRCVGTRFCSNNCPYKVRRFNWFNYNKHLGETEKMGKNPDVTVRARGVMEKCSFCVQRIERAEIQAGIEGRAVRPGEVVTACQQSCPTRAISFGSLTDPDDRLAAALREPRRYAVLHDLGTRPRVTYLARITNPVG